MDATHELRGRLAVITGASAGIGKATAETLAGRGLDLVLGARRVDRVAALAQELAAAHGIRAIGLALDVTDPDSVEAFGAAAMEFAGEAGVHVLVCNAGKAKGVARIPTATRADEDDWAEMFATNVMGLLRTIRVFIGGMLERDRGHVITLGSLAGIETYEGGSVYCATKSSVRIISRALRMELLGTALRVTCINPGLVETEFSVIRLGTQTAADKVYDGMTPCTAQDVAESIDWVVRQPAHMNIEELQLQPVDQASATRVHRGGGGAR
jgi:hypothetical protein